MDPCHHTDDECLVRVAERASQSYEKLYGVMSGILIHCRPPASIKSGETQYSANSGMFIILSCFFFLLLLLLRLWLLLFVLFCSVF